jgi:DNA-binding NarL/FixJ family response regulator
MRGGNGLEVLKQIGEERLKAVVIVLTNYPYPEYEQEARAYGASAFLNKSSQFMKVADLVRELSHQA